MAAYDSFIMTNTTCRLTAWRPGSAPAIHLSYLTTNTTIQLPFSCCDRYKKCTNCLSAKQSCWSVMPASVSLLHLDTDAASKWHTGNNIHLNVNVNLYSTVIEHLICHMHPACLPAFSHPRYEGWPHHEQSFSINIYLPPSLLVLSVTTQSTILCCLSMSSSVYLEYGSLGLYLVLIPSPGSPLSFSIYAHSMPVSFLSQT